MKNLTQKIIMAATLLVTGCGGGSTTTSGGYPDVSGNYTLTDITAICDGLFAPEIEIIQNDEDVILQAQTSGYQDASGTLTTDGDFTVEGEFGDATPFTCSGTIISDIAQATCTAGDTSCDVTYEK